MFAGPWQQPRPRNHPRRGHYLNDQQRRHQPAWHRDLPERRLCARRSARLACTPCVAPSRR
eukprot:scaffold34915_cov58-Phaeocystis_antarctica.AAC.2